MRIDKAEVLDILRSLGKETSQAERELPDTFDTDTDIELLAKYGVSGGDLLAQFEDTDRSTGYRDRAQDGEDVPTGGLLGMRSAGVQGGGAS